MTWASFSILLIAVNSGLFIWIIAYLGVVAYPLLVFLLIIDFLTGMSYVDKQPPPRKALFIYLLIVNILFVSWAGYLMGRREHTADLSGLGLIFLSFPLAIIDFIAAFFYIRTQHHQGIAKLISYIVFIAVSFVLTFLAWYIIGFWLMGNIDIGSDLYYFIVNPTFGALIATVTTLLIMLFLRPKSRK